MFIRRDAISIRLSTVRANRRFPSIFMAGISVRSAGILTIRITRQCRSSSRDTMTRRHDFLVGGAANSDYFLMHANVFTFKGAKSVFKKLSVIAICIAFLCGCNRAQDAKTVIANAQKAMGDVQSITYSGTAKDVAFQQCGANESDMTCKGTHDPMRPIDEYVRVIDLTAPASRHTGKTNNIGAGGSTTVTPGTFFQQVTAQQADVSQPWANSLEFYITPWGFLKGAAANNATVGKGKADGKNYTVLTWSPTVKAASGKNYVINGYIDEQNMVDRVETWLGENIMGDMHILAVYSGWKDFGGVKAPSKIVQTRGEWPFFEVTVTAAKANPSDVAALVPAPAPARGAGGGGGGAPAAPAMNVTSEKLGDGLYRLTTGAGSYDSVIVEFKDYIMMLEAGQGPANNIEARALAYVAETKKR